MNRIKKVSRPVTCLLALLLCVMLLASTAFAAAARWARTETARHIPT